MRAQFKIKDSLQENRTFLSRAVILLFLVIVLFAILLSRLAYLQIETHKKYTALSLNNRVNLSVLPPVRGLIYDNNGVVLAQNNPSYTLELIPEQIDNIEKTLNALSKIIPINEKDIERFNRKRLRSKRFRSIPLRSRLNESEVALFAVNRHLFPGVEVHARLLRHYPFPEITSHIVGYVGAINEKDLKKIDPVNYRETRFIGKTGIERSYENILHGTVGYQQTENTAQGRSIKLLDKTPPITGQDLTLNLDIKLQRIAYDALGEHTGSVVAIDPTNGAIKVFVSKPGFNSNLFVRGISQKDYSALQQASNKPLFDRTLQGQYPPGSTLKPFLGLAGLEANVISKNQSSSCQGYYQLPNQKHKYRDWKKTGHGATNLHDAIVQSCDVYFYKLAHALEIDNMHDFLEKFGFGSPTGIDLLGEKKGLLPSQQWKKDKYGTSWYPGETLIAGIGQGFNLTTPLQLAHATSILANRGIIHKPSIVNKIEGQAIQNTSKPTRGISLNKPNNWATIITAMQDVVEGLRGTARRIRSEHYSIAGKTGTAQVFGIKQEEKYDEDTVAQHLKDHALFIAFAPVDKPQLTIAVIVENGGHGGSVAAPIARAVFDKYFESL